MESLNKEISSILRVKKSIKKCSKHLENNLIICPSKSCSGCHYKSVCNDNQFCGKCVDEIKHSGLEKNQVIIENELNPVLINIQKMEKLLSEITEGLKKVESSSMAAVEAKNRADKIKNRLADLKEDRNRIKRKLI